jgi:chromosome segregation ATPase
MDEQRLEEIVHGALERSWDEVAPSDIIADAIREVLSSQEEELRKLRLDRDTYKLEFESYIEREGACCPEDVGFDEFIKALQAKIGRQEEELRSLREERDDLLHVKAATAHARDLNQTRAREADAELQRLREGMTRTAAELRHAYRQLAAGEVVNQRKFATGLLGPQVGRLELLLASPVEETTDPLLAELQAQTQFRVEPGFDWKAALVSYVRCLEGAPAEEVEIAKHRGKA